MMTSPICVARMIWRSIKLGKWVSGCNSVTDEEETPANVHVLKCKTCGRYSVAWGFNSLEGKK